MGGTTTHGAPFPTGTDRVMDGDNAIQALAEWVDASLWAGAGAGAAPPGQWLPATGVVVCTNGSLAAAPGTSVSRARYMKIGRTVWFQGEATATSAVTGGGAISLPNALAGVPAYRFLNCGSFVVAGGSAPASQQFVGYMHANIDRLMSATMSASYNDFPAGSPIRWNVCYETTT